MANVRWIGLVLAGMLVSACGGGGDEAATAVSPPPDFSRAITTERLQNAAERARQLAHARRHVPRAAPFAADADQQGHARASRAGVVLRVRHVSRPGSDAARRRRRAVHDERLEQGVRAERGDRRADLELRPEGARRRRRESLLRRELARPGAVREQAHHRDARRPAHRARPRDGRASSGAPSPSIRRRCTRSRARRAS